MQYNLALLQLDLAQNTIFDRYHVDAEAKLEKGKTDPISIYAFADFSKFVKSRLSSLIINGAVGSILLAGILFLLLGTRMSLIVSVSIPVSFMAAFMGMSAAGITLNIVSMFALVMVLGMIVDFAIVVSENSYRHMENGMSALASGGKRNGGSFLAFDHHSSGDYCGFWPTAFHDRADWKIYLWNSSGTHHQPFRVLVFRHVHCSQPSGNLWKNLQKKGRG